MTDEHIVDEHLGAVLNEMLDALYAAKQATWSATRAPVRAALQDVTSFLIEQYALVMDAEERIDGRADEVMSPSSHNRGDLLADAKGDPDAAVALVVERLDDVVADMRRRMQTIAGAPEVSMLTTLAAGLDARVGRLRETVAGAERTDGGRHG